MVRLEYARRLSVMGLMACNIWSLCMASQHMAIPLQSAEPFCFVMFLGVIVYLGVDSNSIMTALHVFIFLKIFIQKKRCPFLHFILLRPLNVHRGPMMNCCSYFDI